MSLVEATGQKKTLPAWTMPSTGSSICGFDFDAIDDTGDYHNDVPKRVPKPVFISRLASYAPIIMLLFSAFNNMSRKW